MIEPTEFVRYDIQYHLRGMDEPLIATIHIERGINQDDELMDRQSDAIRALERVHSWVYVAEVDFTGATYVSTDAIDMIRFVNRGEC